MKNKKKVIGNTVFFFALFGLTAYAVLKGKELSELAEVLKSVKLAYYIAGLVMIVVFVCCESFIGCFDYFITMMYRRETVSNIRLLDFSSAVSLHQQLVGSQCSFII